MFNRERKGTGYAGSDMRGTGMSGGPGAGFGRQQQSPMQNMRKKRKRCPFTAAGIWDIDYKDVEKLKKFITDRGKILPRRITGVSAYHQRHLAEAVKRARHMALLPFVGNV